jgi:hypothetical protein
MPRSTLCCSILAALAVVAVIACEGPGTFTGTVNGVPLEVKDSTFVVEKDGAGNVLFASMIMANQPGLCDAVKLGSIPGGYTAFAFTASERESLADGGTRSVRPTPGEYKVSDFVTRSVNVGFHQRDANCMTTVTDSGGTGTVTIDDYQDRAGGSMRGSFDVTFFSHGDHATGRFNAPFCDAAPESLDCRQ